jgi:hypothetical protein
VRLKVLILRLVISLTIILEDLLVNNKIMCGGQSMHKINLLNSFMSAVFLILMSLGMVTDASATAQIFALASSKGITVTAGCQACHTGMAGNESKGNLKAGYQAAYNADKVNLAALKTLINGPTPVPVPVPVPVPAPTPVPSACNLPNQMIGGVCVLPVTGAVGKATSGKPRTDTYKVTCAKGTKYLSVSVKDLLPVNPSKISIQGSKSSSSSPLSTDKSDGDDTYSRSVKLAKGTGVYLVKVNKSKSSTPGAEAYDAQVYCKGVKGVDTGTKVVIRQNQ